LYPSLRKRPPVRVEQNFAAIRWRWWIRHCSKKKKKKKVVDALKEASRYRKIAA
jgi:hypothetical protein